MVTFPFLFMIQASPTFDIMRHFIAKDEENSIKHRKKRIKKYPGYFRRQWFLVMKYPGAKMHFCYFNHRIYLNYNLLQYITEIQLSDQFL